MASSCRKRLSGSPVPPADILLLRKGHRTRPLVLFDVAGEDLAGGDHQRLPAAIVATKADRLR